MTPPNNRESAPPTAVDDGKESQTPDPGLTHKVKTKCFKWLSKHCAFWTVKLAQLICVIYILILTFSPAPIGLVDPETGFIIDVNNSTNTANGVIDTGDPDGQLGSVFRPVVAESTIQMLCLAVSRMSAFSMYPVMVLVFFSKCRATINFLDGTAMGTYLFEDMHLLHQYCGHYIAFDVWVHTLFHLIRWGLHGNISLLWTHATGISGLIVVLVTPAIAFPMMYLVRKMNYELRKGLHFLFFVFAVAMCFHVPVSGIPNGGFLPIVMGITVLWYTLDLLYVGSIMTERIETTSFHRLPTGVQMTMDVSQRFINQGVNGGYCYICLPWVRKNQWHAFSLFEDPYNPQRKQVFMLGTGDWTKEVLNALKRDTARPALIQGPFSSPYNNAIEYDNQILVASGIGITPALSVIRAHKATRRINLIWVTRDPYMLEFFLERFDLDDDAWNLIFYTGKQTISPALEELKTNVRIIKERPDLQSIIPRIIYGIESGKGLPEAYMSANEELVQERLLSVMQDAEKAPSIKLREMHEIATREGMSLTEMGNRLGGANQLLDGTTDDADTTSPEQIFMSHRRISLDKRDNGLAFLGLQAQDSIAEDAKPPERPGIGQLQRLTSIYSTVFDKSNQSSGDVAHEYVKGMDKECLNTWGMLYCGGAKPVEDTLNKVSRKYNLSLNTESFAW